MRMCPEVLSCYRASTGLLMLTLSDALDLLLTDIKDEVVIHSNGLLSRFSYALADRERNFYMLGSMGLAFDCPRSSTTPPRPRGGCIRRRWQLAHGLR